MIAARPEFMKWATEGLGGIDGGNPFAPIWICGLEWGRPKGEEEWYLPEVSKMTEYKETGLQIGKFWVPHMCHEERVKPPKTPRAMARLCLSTLYDNEKRNMKWGEVFTDAETGYCARAGDMFALNLYPIAFRSFDDSCWPKEVAARTGIMTKAAYREWCADLESGRFAALRDLLRICTNGTKVVLCTGTGTGTLDRFVRAFNPNIDTAEVRANSVVKLPYNNKRRGEFNVYWFPAAVDSCMVYVVPFLARYGSGNLMAYADLDDVGSWVRSRHFNVSC